MSLPRAASSSQSLLGKEGGRILEDLALKKRNVYSDLERQLFNIDTSIAEFRKNARDLEAKSVAFKLKCRWLLTSRKKSSAWDLAKKALHAERTSFLYNEASVKMRRLVHVIRKVEDLDPVLLKVLKELDFAVRADDPQRVKELATRLEDELDLGQERHSNIAEKDLTDEDVSCYLNRLEEEVNILESIRAGSKDQGPSPVLCHLTADNEGSIKSRDSQASHSSAQANVGMKKRRNQVRIRKTSKAIRFSLPQD